MNTSIRLAGLMLCAAATPALAGDDGWSWRLTPYVWAPTMYTDVVVGEQPPTSSDVGLLDVLDFAFLASFEGRKGNWGVLGEFNYLALSQRASPPPGFGAAKVGLDGVLAGVAGTYRVFADDRASVDLLAGLRYWDLKTSVNFDNLGDVSTSKSWVDPIFGVRASYDLTPDIFVDGQFDIGGFGVGSDLQWEAIGRVGYRVSETVGAAVGYRHLDVDFNDDGLVMNLTLTGPFVAVDFNF
jgi:hypothetical protein